MFESIIKFFKKLVKAESQENNSGSAAKERLHLVLMQDRANVSADFLDMMKQEIIEVIKKYIDVDENAIDVRLTNKTNEDGTNGAPALYANIPIVSIKEDTKRLDIKHSEKKEDVKKDSEEEIKEKENENKEVSEEIENTDEQKKEEKEEAIKKQEEKIKPKKENVNEEDNKNKDNKKVNK